MFYVLLFVANKTGDHHYLKSSPATFAFIVSYRVFRVLVVPS